MTEVCAMTRSRPGPGASESLNSRETLEWRRAGHLWEGGRVVYAAQLRPGRWASVEGWLPAELLTTE
jgi:hypothetical protein